mgnify:CR=1 FL=1
MRIIHDIEGEAQVSFSGDQYIRPLNKPDYPGYFKVSGVIVASDPLGGEDEVIHIEGNSKYIIEVFEEALSQMKAIDELYREEEAEKGENQDKTTLPEGSGAA